MPPSRQPPGAVKQRSMAFASQTPFAIYGGVSTSAGTDKFRQVLRMRSRDRQRPAKFACAPVESELNAGSHPINIVGVRGGDIRRRCQGRLQSIALASPIDPPDTSDLGQPKGPHFTAKLDPAGSTTASNTRPTAAATKIDEMKYASSVSTFCRRLSVRTERARTIPKRPANEICSGCDYRRARIRFAGITI